jgi:NAD(P)H-dependent nitrite reductase small subunit|tara:strand:- start:286 stop:594 length:309 start_codon:yes stop_codon:yes gene_type:complete
MAEFVTVANKNDLQPGSCKVVDVNGKAIALHNVNGEFFATDNICPHKKGPLGEGTLEGEEVSCPWHQWKFNVKTGVSPVNPEAKIETFEVKVEGDEVKVASK